MTGRRDLGTDRLADWRMARFAQRSRLDALFYVLVRARRRRIARSRRP